MEWKPCSEWSLVHLGFRFGGPSHDRVATDWMDSRLTPNKSRQKASTLCGLSFQADFAASGGVADGGPTSSSEPGTPGRAGPSAPDS